jgi:hypothetical protein
VTALKRRRAGDRSQHILINEEREREREREEKVVYAAKAPFF